MLIKEPDPFQKNAINFKLWLNAHQNALCMAWLSLSLSLSVPTFKWKNPDKVKRYTFECNVEGRSHLKQLFERIRADKTCNNWCRRICFLWLLKYSKSWEIWLWLIIFRLLVEMFGRMNNGREKNVQSVAKIYHFWFPFVRMKEKNEKSE